MNTNARNYVKHPHCFIGEIDGYGYAFVPGGKSGVVILDLKSKKLLEDFSEFEAGINKARVELLRKNGLLIDKYTGPDFGRPLGESRARSLGTWLHVTNNCNLSCSYCYICKDSGQMSDVVANAYLNKLEATVEKYNLGSVSIRFAGGEPTLRKSLVYSLVQEIHARFDQKGVKINLTLITNGVLLNNEWIDFMKKYDMRLCISLDGVEGWHDKIRFLKNGKGTFQLVWQNIQQCQQAGLEPTILTTITEENLSGLEEFNRRLVDSNLRFRYGIYRNVDGDHRLHQDFIRRLSVVLRASYKYYEDVIRVRKTSFQHQLVDIRIDTNRHLRCCSAGHSGITVKHDGTIHLCQSRMNTVPIGTVRDDLTFIEMLETQNVLPDFRDKDVRNYIGCNECGWALTCGGGCPFVNRETYGTMTMASPYCEVFKEFIPRLVELKALSLVNNYKERR